MLDKVIVLVGVIFDIGIFVIINNCLIVSIVWCIFVCLIVVSWIRGNNRDSNNRVNRVILLNWWNVFLFNNKW